MIRNICLVMAVWGTLGIRALPAWAARERIDLAEFGHVVHLAEVPTRATASREELTRGADGWDVVRDEDGQYSIGIEWDAPREICEVNIEFRHAIAHREWIKVQYWAEPQADSPPAHTGRDKAGSEKPGRGRWLTPKADWWAGDRDVSFAFGTQDREAGTKNEPGVVCRRTSRLRFVCGKQDLPPVRFLHAYGPGKVTTDTFDVRFDEKSTLKLPVIAELSNGFAMAGDGKTTLDTTTIRDVPATLVLRYFRDDKSSPNRTEVRLSPVDRPEQRCKFVPAEAAHNGMVRIASAGVVIERRGGKLPSTRSAEDVHPKLLPSGSQKCAP